MSQNIVEYFREKTVTPLFDTDGFSNAWSVWKSEINNLTSAKDVYQILYLGDSHRNIFILQIRRQNDFKVMWLEAVQIGRL